MEATEGALRLAEHLLSAIVCEQGGGYRIPPEWLETTESYSVSCSPLEPGKAVIVSTGLML